MVIKNTSKRNRYCVFCKHSHPEKQPCEWTGNPSSHLRKRMIKYNIPSYLNVDKLDNEEINTYEKFVNQYTKSFKKTLNRFNHRDKKRNRDKHNVHKSFPIQKQKTNKTKSVSIKECPVCMTQKKVKSLPCQHHMCTDCYKTMLRSSSCNDSCPICRTNLFKECTGDYVCIHNQVNNQRTYSMIRVELVSQE